MTPDEVAALIADSLGWDWSSEHGVPSPAEACHDAAVRVLDAMAPLLVEAERHDAERGWDEGRQAGAWKQDNPYRGGAA